MKARTISLLFSIYLPLMSSGAFGADAELHRAQIRINHKQGTYVLKTWEHTYRELPGHPLENSQAFILKPGERVSVWIDDPNPFFYSYAWSVGGSTSTANAEAVQTFTKSLLQMINSLEPPKASADINYRRPIGTQAGSQVALASYHLAQMQGEIDPRSSEEVLRDAAAQLQSLSMVVNPAPGLDDASNAEAIVSHAIKIVESKNVPIAGRNVVRKVLTAAGIREPQGFLRKFKAALARLYLYSLSTKALLQQVDSGQGDVAKEVIKGWNLPDLESDIESAYDGMHKVGEALQAKLSSEEAVRSGVIGKVKLFAGYGPDVSLDELKKLLDSQAETLNNSYSQAHIDLQDSIVVNDNANAESSVIA